MNITIKSASSKNKEEHNKSALLNLISASVGAVTFDMSAGIQIVASTAMVLMDPNDDNIESLKLASLGASSDEVVGFISKLGSAFLILKGFKGALSDFFYQSNADYVGNIKIDMHLGSQGAV